MAVAKGNCTNKKNKTATGNTKNNLRKFISFYDPRGGKYRTRTHQACVLVLAVPLNTIFVNRNNLSKSFVSRFL